MSWPYWLELPDCFDSTAFDVPSQNKLDGYIKEEESGKALDDMQQMAVSKYEEVVQQLSLSKEFCKQFQAIAVAASKEAKREARKVSNSVKCEMPLAEIPSLLF